MRTGVYANTSQIKGGLPSPGGLPPWRSVLMATPSHFTVAYAINPHMRAADGALNTVDPPRARSQWEVLRKTYEALGYPVRVIEGAEGLPDMVFAANQSLPFPAAAGGGVVSSRMRHPERAAEVPLFDAWFRARDFEVRDLGTEGPALEGSGDLLWVPGRRLLLGGYGHRTEPRALEQVSATLDVPVLGFALVDARFYHLDTCIAPIDQGRALWVPSAFDDAGADLLARVFPRLIEVPEEEAVAHLGCNAHCPDGRHVVIEEGALRTRALLEAEGLRVHPVQTSEFLCAGGSVFCLKQMLF